MPSAAETEPASGVVRRDLIEHVREQIAAGTYVTPGKLRIVAERLAAQLEEEPEPAAADERR